MEFTKKLLIFSALLVAAALLPVSAASAAQPAQTRVIVTLAIPAAAPGEDQSATISQATDALLALLPGGDYTVTNRYTVSPYVAIAAGPTTLTVLSAMQHSGLVAAVERDVTVSAASGTKKCKTVKTSKKGKKAKSAKCSSAPVIH